MSADQGHLQAHSPSEDEVPGPGRLHPAQAQSGATATTATTAGSPVREPDRNNHLHSACRLDWHGSSVFSRRRCASRAATWLFGQRGRKLDHERWPGLPDGQGGGGGGGGGGVGERGGHRVHRPLHAARVPGHPPRRCYGYGPGATGRRRRPHRRPPPSDWDPNYHRQDRHRRTRRHPRHRRCRRRVAPPRPQPPGAAAHRATNRT